MTMLASIVAAALTLQPFGEVKVVDEIDCTKADHRFADSPKGASKVVDVAGRKCRTLAVQQGKSSYLTWRVGEGKGLKPNGALVFKTLKPVQIVSFRR